MKHFDLELEKLEKRIAPGGFSGKGPKSGGGSSKSGKSGKSRKSRKSRGGKCK